MQETQKEVIANALRAYIGKGNSQEQAAKLCGISAANVSHILHNRWQREGQEGGYVIGEGIFRKIQQGLGLRLNVVPTENFRAVTAALAKAKAEARCMLVDGDTGVGKTFACEEFKRQNPTGTVLVACSSTLSAQGLLALIAEAVGLDMPKGVSNGEVLNRLAERLLRYPAPLLVLDEMEEAFKAGNGKSKRPQVLFGLVKDLQRATAGRMGIVLVGVGIWHKLRQKVSYGAGDFATLLDRFEQVPPVLLGGIGQQDEEEVGRAFGLGGRKGLKAALGGLSDQRPCKNYRALIGRLEEMQTMERIEQQHQAA